MTYVPTEEDKANPYVVCEQPYNGRKIMIQCSCCAGWSHLRCSGLRQTPKNTKDFLCGPCQSKRDKEGEDSIEITVEDPQIKWAMIEEETDKGQLASLENRLAQMESEHRQETAKLQNSLDLLLARLKTPTPPLTDPQNPGQIKPIGRQIGSTSKEIPSLPENQQNKQGEPGEKEQRPAPTHQEELESIHSGESEDILPETPEKESEAEKVPKIPRKHQKNSTQIHKEKPAKQSEAEKVPRRPQQEKPEEEEDIESEIELDFDVSSIEKPRTKSSASKSSRPPPGYFPAATDVFRKQTLRKLPEFDGKTLAVWPHFLNAYNYSTEHGPFSDEENTLRLSDFVKGEALSLIEGFLMNPVGAPEAMNVLIQWYGDIIEIRNQLKEDVLKMPRPKENVKDSFRDFSAKLKMFVNFLQGMKEGPQQLQNDETIRQIVSRLPSAIQARWYDAVAMTKRVVTLRDLDNFVTRMALSYKNVTFVEDSSKNKADKIPVKNKRHQHQTFLHEREREDGSSTPTHQNKENGQQSGGKPGSKPPYDPYCHLCEKVGHKLADCADFKNLNLEKRKELVRKRVLCLTCLRKRHDWTRCRKNKDKKNPEAHPLLQEPKAEGGGSQTVLSHYQKGARKVLFRVVPVVLHGFIKKIHTFAILDDCSSVTLLEQSVAEQLQITPSEKGVKLRIQWTQDTVANLKSNKYSLSISGKASGAKQYKIKNVFAVPDLKLPLQTIDAVKMKQCYPYLEDAEIESLLSARPTILLGLEHAKLGTPLQTLEGGFQQPIAMKTRLGWTLHGPNPTGGDQEAHHTFLINSEMEEDLHELVKYNFTTESFGIKPPGPSLESMEDARAKKLLEENAIRRGDRFEAPLLWKEDKFEMPKSLEMATWRLVSLEKKLLKDLKLREQYSEKIQDYLKKGYAVKLNRDELAVENPRSWFLTHFPVQTIFKPKPRLVFDAAAKVKNKSLNSFLLSGPDIYVQLPHVLLSQRLYRVAVVADIAEMFHQVIISEKDRAAQRFLWRDCDQTKAPEVYQMNRMIFGATSSPFVAQWIKNRNAEDFKEDYPDAYKSILQNHYVDDFIQSFPDENEAIRISTEVKLVHQKGGFNLRNFVSNNPQVQKTLSEEKDVAIVNLDKDQGAIHSQKVLGLFWMTEPDIYVFKNNYLEKLKINPGQRPTKREFLRLLMSVFDPFGFIANYMIHGKLLLQDIWASKIDWDEKLRDEEFTKFSRWIGEIEKIKEFRLPRCISPMIPDANSLELHVFSDASDSAFSCVIYLRVQKNQKVDLSLLGSKTRVAPSRKRLSIPRLELQGFILGIRWAKFLLEGLKELNLQKIVHWCDSKTVLSWVHSPSRKFNKFVENRISEALEYMEEFKMIECRFVPTNLNVADEATKYVKPVDVSPSSNWICGPEFLLLSPENWPESPVITEEVDEICVTFLHQTIVEKSGIVDFSRYSSYGKLVRVTGWVIRFVENLKKNCEKVDLVKKSWPTSDEISRAKVCLIKQAQLEAFPKEVIILKEGQDNVNDLPKDSEILRLNPIKHEGIIRLGSRIKAANCVGFNTKFPIILGKSHHFTNLLLDEYHRLFAHQHLETCVNEIRQAFWIPDLRVCVKKAKSRCQNCKNIQAKPVSPQMGNLPPERVTPFVNPFTYTGMDVFGPINISVGRSSQKRWVVLYTCLGSRAVHMEVIHSLSTDSCIMAYRNFVNIRRKPHKIFCDNGTNFVGMNNELKKAWKEWKKSASELNNKIIIPTDQFQTEFCFNPPASPHMGGVWERLVRTIKNVFKVITKGARLHEESLRCFVNESMNIVNCRPLSYLPLEHGMAAALTPNGILKLENIGESSPGIFNESDMIGRKQWRIAQLLADQFWRRWVREILPDMTRRTKWYCKTDPLKVGDYVIIVDETTERNKWSRGQVEKIYPDSTGQVRFADVRTSSGILRRPAVKLAVLDVL